MATSQIILPGLGSAEATTPVAGQNYGVYKLVSQSANEVVYQLDPGDALFGKFGAPRAKDQIAIRFLRKGAGQGGNDRATIRSQITVFDSNNKPYTLSSTFTLSVPRILDASLVGDAALGEGNLEFVKNQISKMAWLLGAASIKNSAGQAITWGSTPTTNSTWPSLLARFQHL